VSGIATGTALLIAGGLGAAGGVASGLIGSNAAQNAASTQASAAEQNAQMQGALGQEQLTAEEQQNQQNQANLQPFLQSGDNADATLQYLLGLGGQNPATGGVSQGAGQTLSIPGVNGSVNIPGVTTTTGTASTQLGPYGSLMQGYGGGQFQAPTLAQAQQAPGYQFGLQQGEGALQAGAAANGSLLTGGTQNALDQYAQNYADTNYNNVYNQALQTYGTNYNVWANQQASEYNKLASMAGMGQTTAQTLNTEGLTSTGQIANTLGQTGQNIAQQNSNAAAATASGYIGSGNALSGMFSGLGGNASQMAMLYALLNQQNSQGAQDANQVNGMMAGGNSL
jgi:predicted flap endonuclease-1-like 5' DNA nuclease